MMHPSQSAPYDRPQPPAGSNGSRFTFVGRTFKALGIAGLLGMAAVESASAQGFTTSTRTWSGGTDFNDSVSPVFYVPNATVVTFSLGSEYAHSHGGPVVVGVQV